MTPLKTLAVAGVLALIAAGCAGGEEDAAGEYPFAETEPLETQPPVTTPEGAVISLPVLPTEHEVEPTPTCERSIAHSPDGPRTIVIPPAPGLRAIAVNRQTTRLEWSFADLPNDCRPTRLLLAVVNGSNVRATPTVIEVDVTAESGSAEIEYAEFLSPPNVAHAAVYSSEGFSSRTVKVLIQR